jgi:hypothetical protein
MTEKSENTVASATTPSAEKTAAAERAERVSHVVERAAELSDEVLESVESGGRTVIGAVRKFVDTVDEALPAAGDRPPRRKTIVDAALDLADRLVTVHSGFIRSVVASADQALRGKPDEVKPEGKR